MKVSLSHSSRRSTSIWQLGKPKIWSSGQSSIMGSPLHSESQGLASIQALSRMLVTGSCTTGHKPQRMNTVVFCSVWVFWDSWTLSSQQMSTSIWRPHMTVRRSEFSWAERHLRSGVWTNQTPRWCVCTFQLSCHTLLASITAYQFNLLLWSVQAYCTKRRRIVKSQKCCCHKSVRSPALTSWRRGRDMLSRQVWH